VEALPKIPQNRGSEMSITEAASRRKNSTGCHGERRGQKNYHAVTASQSHDCGGRGYILRGKMGETKERKRKMLVGR